MQIVAVIISGTDFCCQCKFWEQEDKSVSWGPDSNFCWTRHSGDLMKLCMEAEARTNERSKGHTTTHSLWWGSKTKSQILVQGLLLLPLLLLPPLLLKSSSGPAKKVFHANASPCSYLSCNTPFQSCQPSQPEGPKVGAGCRRL